MTARREWLGRLGLAAFGTVVGLLGVEVALRLHDPLGQRVRGDRLILPTSTRVVMDLRGSHKLDPQVVETRNTLGFRGPEPPRDFDAHLTLVAVGGSVTECRFLTDGRDWPAVLGRRLDPALDRLWVNNAGLDGHSTFGHLQLMRQRVVALRPDVVLFLVGINDVALGALKTQDEALTVRDDIALVDRLARHSAVVGTALNAWRARQAARLGLNRTDLHLPDVPQSLTPRRRADEIVGAHLAGFVPAYAGRVRELVALARQAGSLPVLITQPALYGPARDDVTGVDVGGAEVYEDGTNGRAAWRVLEAYNDATRAVAAETGTRVVDLARAMPKSSRLYYDWVHFTNDGAEEAARVVAAELCPVLAERFPAHRRGTCPPPVSGPAGPSSP